MVPTVRATAGLKSSIAPVVPSTDLPAAIPQQAHGVHSSSLKRVLSSSATVASVTADSSVSARCPRSVPAGVCRVLTQARFVFSAVNPGLPEVPSCKARASLDARSSVFPIAVFLLQPASPFTPLIPPPPPVLIKYKR